ncbi:uncharacterized protein AB675_7476 [Cyphellophora attinorum]|uniref:non-specific serine/threonine protein kinase n=1 Tax=Cyphellophora attinorum TaxID=1664694 RepID=A0A0N1H9T5_9EURO|nr:uncharacterized protein AB675_7476 [Phialophora attinorum]KPI40382.1 hypothetical protein AB675_7476 [Phialophora attinorum]
MSGAPTTPPHHPTHNVHLTDQQLEAIISTVLPSHAIINASAFTHGHSFNNRIYFLDLTDSLHTNTISHELVLRVSGHYFNHRKVENEVGWLLRFREFCPSVPVPEVVAWSTDGAKIETLDRGFLKVTGRRKKVLQGVKHGWVLQTRLPGRRLTIEDLDGIHGDAILRQLAEHMATWRTVEMGLPWGTGSWSSPGGGGARIGNQCLFTAAHGKSPGIFWRPKDSRMDLWRGFVTGGLLLTHRQDTGHEGLRTWAEYYQFVLDDQIAHMMTAAELSGLRAMIDDRVTALRERLAHLPFLDNASNIMKFTHMDFAPRNILISTDDTTASSPPQVTGILDFEFSALLPAPSEFLNSLVNQSGDWQTRHYNALLSHLRAIEKTLTPAPGDPSITPRSICISVMEPPAAPCIDPDRCECEYHNFEKLKVLEAVVANVAPWYITQVSHIGKERELEAECAKAANVVLDGVERLLALLAEGLDDGQSEAGSAPRRGTREATTLRSETTATTSVPTTVVNGPDRARRS